MKKIGFTLLLISVSVYASLAQQIVTACCDDTICQPGLDVQLTAVTDSGTTGSILNIEDDTYSQIVNLGFSFTYFGNTYTKCVLSTNNYICFDTTLALQYSQWPITAAIPDANYAADGVPVNSIMGPWHDVDPSQPPYGTLSFGTFGVAPNRYFVYNFCGVPMYQCNDTLYSGEIILYETSSIIEMHIGQKRVCYTWNGGYAIQGLHNIDGTDAVVVPGRNYPDVWTAFNEGWRFTPNGTTYDLTSITYAPIAFAAGTPHWSTLNGNSVGDGYTITVNPTQTTTYVVTVASCAYNADTVTITVDTLFGDYSTIDPTCPNSGDGTISASASGSGGPFIFVWVNSNGDTLKTTSNSLNDQVSGLNAGSYVVTIINGTGCSTTHTFNINYPPFVASFLSSDTSICLGANITFTDQSIGAITGWAWSFGDGVSTNTQNPNHTYQVPGVYTVQLVISNQGGCIDTAKETITVNDNIHVSFTEDPPPYCVGVPIQFTDQSTAQPAFWAWDFGDGSTSDVQNPQHAYSSEGTYTVHVTITDAFCGEGDFSYTLTVNTIPDPQLREDTMLCPTEPLTLNANAEAPSYQWSTGATTEEIQILAPSSPTVYTVILDNFGCKGTDSVLITPNCILVLPSAFSPNADGANDILHPLGSHLANFQLIIYNRWGKEIYNRQSNNLLDGWDGTYEGEPQQIGVYVYVLKGNFVNGEAVSRTGNVTLVR